MTPEVPAEEVLDLLDERIVRYRLDDLTILYCNPSWARANGATPADFVGRTMDEVLTAVEQEALRRQVEHIGPDSPLLRDNLTATRGNEWTEWTDHFLDSGGVHQMVAIGRDVTERRNAELRLAASEERYRELALRDELTGLANRRLLDELLDVALARSRRSGDRLVLSYLDLDGFKAVNDVYGHTAGDQVLKDVAHRLRTSVRDADAIARVGGDEFIVLQECTAGGDTCCDERLDEILTQPFVIEVDGAEVTVTCGVSIGSATAGPGSDAAALYAAADAAMYRVKHRGRARV